MAVYIGPGIPSNITPPTPLPESNPLKTLGNMLEEMGVDIRRRSVLAVEGEKISARGTQFVCDSIHDFPEIAAKIKEIGKSVRFIELPLPSDGGCLAVQSHLWQQVWARYVIGYHIGSDGLIGRWDFLVEAV